MDFLLPGKDYKVKGEAPPEQGWIPFESNEFIDEYRHTWVLKRGFDNLIDLLAWCNFFIGSR